MVIFLHFQLHMPLIWIIKLIVTLATCDSLKVSNYCIDQNYSWIQVTWNNFAYKICGNYMFFRSLTRTLILFASVTSFVLPQSYSSLFPLTPKNRGPSTEAGCKGKLACSDHTEDINLPGRRWLRGNTHKPYLP